MNEQKAKHIRLAAIAVAEKAYETDKTPLVFRAYEYHEGTSRLAQRLVFKEKQTAPKIGTEEYKAFRAEQRAARPGYGTEEYLKWTAEKNLPELNEDGSLKLEEYVMHPGKTSLNPLCIRGRYVFMKKQANKVERADPPATKKQLAAEKAEKQRARKQRNQRAKAAKARASGWRVAAGA